MKLFRHLLHMNKKSAPPPAPAPAPLPALETADIVTIKTSLAENERSLDQALFHTDDLVKLSLTYQNQNLLLCYLDPMCDEVKIRSFILKPMAESEAENLADVFTAPRVYAQTSLDEAADTLLQGQAVLFKEGSTECYSITVNAEVKRTTEEPENEKTVRGSHEGFVENMTVNLHLIRKQIKNRHLVIRRYTLGQESRTEVAVAYLNHVAKPELIREIDARLRAIAGANILSTNLLEEYIEDRTMSPFPQILTTERPDRAAANLLEGRAVLMSAGTPSALVLPVTFFSFYQSPDDYYSRTLAGSFIRFIRLLSFVIAITLPAFYIAVITFHYEVIPAELLFQIKGSVEIVPYPPLLEAMFMELTLELLREAGIRLPGPIGQTIGIVGGLVIGDAVVRVGLVSYPMIIVVALTAISSFIVPSHEMSASVRLLRFAVMIPAALLGFIGIVFSLIFILIHLCKLESFGTPYLAPAAPFRLKDWKDTIFRFPLWKKDNRVNMTKPLVKQENADVKELQENDTQFE
ncbi:spore germination protein [Paenibacillus chitinolyticus]|uniref:spore germination protein n=1 Tax=Paenibacillus chitinolyticus TaxID=79263 RepID=UPI003CFD4FA5